MDAINRNMRDIASPPPPQGIEANEHVPEWWNVYEGLSDEEIDRLDEAIRERADLTRHFE
jgi:hypothetical protein